MTDQFGRNIDYLRVSVTDRCNLRCVYCMPEGGVPWVPHGEILTYEQIVRLCRVFAALGVRSVKLTGGEPLVRQGLSELVRGLKKDAGLRSVTLTTNGMLLEQQLPALVAAGLDGVNISIDALDEDCFAAITRRTGAAVVQRAIFAALDVPGLNVKINCVPIGINDGELVGLARLAQTRNIAVRFIERMPIGIGAQGIARTHAQVRNLLEQSLGPLHPAHGPRGSGPCRYFAAEGFVGRLGFISAVSHPFCHTCNRVRLTARGFLKTCLQYSTCTDLRDLLAVGAQDDVIAAAILAAVREKPRSHRFSEGAVPDGEDAGMSQIGG